MIQPCRLRHRISFRMSHSLTFVIFTPIGHLPQNECKSVNVDPFEHLNISEIDQALKELGRHVAGRTYLPCEKMEDKLLKMGNSVELDAKDPPVDEQAVRED